MTELFKEKILNGIADNYLNEAIKYGRKKKEKSAVMVFVRIAACIIVIFGLSCSSLVIAAASGNITAYDVLYTLYPKIALKLMPVYASCEDEGIRMAVEGIRIEDNCAYVYISMQDLEGMRIDESIDLFDSYSIHTNADQIGGCTLIDFDEENKKATFLIAVQHMDGSPVEGSVMTFSVSKILTGKKEMQTELTQICPVTISEVTETQAEESLDIRGGSYREEYIEMSGKYLCVDESKLFVPTPGVMVTNYGLINDKLHIQVYYEEILKYDKHGYIYLSDAEGNKVLPEYSTAFWDEEKQGSYEEYLFDISGDSLENYKIYGHFFTCQNLVEGDWEVRVRIE